ncbi:Uncharacterised protein [Sphingobacterium thalpophilum]|uniref:Uncharacterized protein n=1 Tax=Sphingobacterium thalpophilum TaxID=259 RepID=A0A4U9V418_9SPHI|nr:Uncharacterised protein [Sphingobacterium thalpophilum]
MNAIEKPEALIWIRYIRVACVRNYQESLIEMQDRAGLF